MTDGDSPRPDFESVLRREVERVLADPVFQRSPVQSRLLAYLRDETLARRSNVSQIAVAVDGLGRPEGADQLTESYPRVQVSRLRRNLALYYARCAPGEGVAVYIPHGSYQLRLAPPGSAYAEQRQRGPAPAAANDTPPPAAPAAPPEVPKAAPAPSWPALAAAFGVIALAALAPYWLGRGSADIAATAPSLEVEIDPPAAGAPPDPLLALAMQHAGDASANSYVVRNRRPGESGADGYVVRLSRSEALGGVPVLQVSLFDPANQRVFADTIPIGEERAVVLERLNGALLHIVGPAGVIVRRELSRIGEEPDSDYECVIRTESDRLQGSLATERVEYCLTRFPDSAYRAYWLTRLAFNAYREQVLAGGVVTASGAPWQNLQRAFAADSANPFANYVAAKVSFARDDCVGAQPYIDRTLSNGNFHGTLTAATLSDAALCSGSLMEHHNAEARVASLVNGIPEPNPLLHLYLVFAAAAVDRPDLARRVLAAPASEETQGALAAMTSALQDGLASPDAFASNRARLQQVVDGFYWGTGPRRKLMEKLAAVAAYRD